MSTHPAPSPRPGSLLALLAADGTNLSGDITSPAKRIAHALAKRMGGGAATGKASTVAKPAVPSQPVKHSPTYWEPLEIILWTSAWKCGNCNTEGTGTPALMLRERHRRNDTGGEFIERMTAIASPLQYAHLPRSSEVAEPSIVHTCPHCFATTLQHPQRTLPGIEPEPLTPYVKPPMEKLYDNYAAMRAAATHGTQSKGLSL